MRNTALFALSSPEGDDNYYSQLMNLDDPNTGRKFFRVENCFMICDACLKLPREKQIQCTHKRQTAHWISKRKSERLRVLYAACPEVAIREFGGISVSDYVPCFRREEIAAAWALPPVRCESAPQYVFIACDPNGGGPSRMAIASAYYDRAGRIVFVGLDAETVRDDKEEYLLIRRHIDRLRQIRVLAGVRKVFIPENNLGLEAAHLDTMVQDYADVTTYWENDSRPGIRKGPGTARNYQFYLNNLLSTNAVRFDEELFTVTAEKTPAQLKAQLREEAERYHWEKRAANDAFQRDRYAMTGKLGSKQDDLLIAAMMAMYFGRAVINNPSRLSYSCAVNKSHAAARE